MIKKTELSHQKTPNTLQIPSAQHLTCAPSIIYRKIVWNDSVFCFLEAETSSFLMTISRTGDTFNEVFRKTLLTNVLNPSAKTEDSRNKTYPACRPSVGYKRSCNARQRRTNIKEITEETEPNMMYKCSNMVSQALPKNIYKFLSRITPTWQQFFRTIDNLKSFLAKNTVFDFVKATNDEAQKWSDVLV